MVELKINAKFQSAERALTAEEFAQLEANIIADKRVLSPIVFWHEAATDTRWIVDGHHRFSIAKRHNIPYRVEPLDAETEDDVLIWIYNAHTGRRNRTPEEIRYAIGACYNLTQKKHPGANIGLAPGRTAVAIGDAFNVSARTVHRAAQDAIALESIDPEARDAILSGEISATSQDIKQFAALPPEVKEQVEQAVKSKEVATVAAALAKAGIPDRRSRDAERMRQRRARAAAAKLASASDVVHETECEQGGKHVWVSDGEGERYCELCKEDHPKNKTSQPSIAKHLNGMTKTIDTLLSKIDEMKAHHAVGDELWTAALKGLDEARKAFAKLSRK